MTEDNSPRDIFSEFLSKYAAGITAQSERMHPSKSELLSLLSPWRPWPQEIEAPGYVAKPDSMKQDDAWREIVTTAMQFNSMNATGVFCDDAVYNLVEKFAQALGAIGDKNPLGEFRDFRVTELYLLAAQITSTRPKRSHARDASPRPEFIIELAKLYERRTGKRAGAGDGPFARFFWLFWQAMGNDRAYDTVIKDIKKAL